MSRQDRFERQRLEQAARDRATPNNGHERKKERRVHQAPMPALDSSSSWFDEFRVNITAADRAERARLMARTAYIPCECAECEGLMEVAALPFGSTISAKWGQKISLEFLTRHGPRKVMAPSDFADDSEELRLWKEAAPNMGAEEAAEMVRALLEPEAA